MHLVHAVFTPQPCTVSFLCLTLFSHTEFVLVLFKPKKNKNKKINNNNHKTKKNPWIISYDVKSCSGRKHGACAGDIAPILKPRTSAVTSAAFVKHRRSLPRGSWHVRRGRCSPWLPPPLLLLSITFPFLSLVFAGSRNNAVDWLGRCECGSGGTCANTSILEEPEMFCPKPRCR